MKIATLLHFAFFCSVRRYSREAAWWNLRAEYLAHLKHEAGWGATAGEANPDMKACVLHALGLADLRTLDDLDRRVCTMWHRFNENDKVRSTDAVLC